MNIEDRFKLKGSELNQVKSQKFGGQSVQVPMNVFNSNLDLNGVSRVMDLKSKQTTIGLQNSKLDLDGRTPKNNYRDNSPEGRQF